MYVQCSLERVEGVGWVRTRAGLSRDRWSQERERATRRQQTGEWLTLITRNINNTISTPAISSLIPTLLQPGLPPYSRSNNTHSGALTR